MKDCDILQNAADSIIAEAEVAEEAAEQYIDQQFQADPEHPAFAKSPIKRMLIKLAGSRKTVTRKKIQDQIKKDYGTQAERQALALEIRTKISAVPELAKAIIEEITLDITALGTKMQKNFFEIDPKTGETKILLYKLPIRTLKRELRFVDAWIGADPDKWDSLYYRGIRLAWGITRKLRMTENSGAYHRVWKATQNFADRQAAHINKFMNPEAGKSGTKKAIWTRKKNKQGKMERVQITRNIRDHGMSDLLDDVEEIYDSIDNNLKDDWESPGFWGGRNEDIGKEKVVELFAWMMHGRVEYVDKVKASRVYERGELKGQPIYAHGEGWYINTQMAPTTKTHDNGDVMFSWQKPVPLEYYKRDKEGNLVPAYPEAHGSEDNMVITDAKGRNRYDTFDLIKNLPPLNDELMGKLTAIQAKARDIMDESFEYLTNETEKSFVNILAALKRHFPNKSILQLRSAIVDGNFYDKQGNELWTNEERAALQLLEDNFTKWSLENPFKPTMTISDYKTNYFPYIYMPENFVFLIEDAIESMEVSLEKVDGAIAAATGSELQTLKKQKNGLEQSIERQREMKQSLLGAEIDQNDEDKMLTRTKSKHFKHVSNAFDVLKSRVDRGIFRNYLEHSVRSVERNNLTAELIHALSMTEHKAVRDAFISLYKGTLGRGDARSLVFGMDLSDANLSPRTVRGLKAVRKYWNTMLSGPQTAIKQSYGFLEKINKAGFKNMIEAITYVNQNRKKLQRLLQESGITLFDEFFTNSIVSELEAMEASRDTINAMLRVYGDFYSDVKKIGKNAAAKRMNKRMTKLWGVSDLNWEKILSPEEKKLFDSKMKTEKLQRITNKLTNWAINNEPVMRKIAASDPMAWNRALYGAQSGIKAFRKVLGRAGIMSEMERYLRETSFILGVFNARKVGYISSNVPIHEYQPGTRDWNEAINMGRKTTNLMLDFSMSRQGVGELYRSALGSLLGGFSVWKTQKFASDVDLFKNVARTVDTLGRKRDIPLTILKSAREIVKKDEVLEKTNPDALNLKRWLRTQFLIEGFFQALFVLPILPGAVRSAAYTIGARNLGGAGSPLAGLIWAPIFMLVNAALDDDDPWDDAKDAERVLAYHVRNLPGVGVGIGFIYDAIIVLLAAFAGEDQLMGSKALGMSTFAYPEGITGQAVKTGVGLAKTGAEALE